MKISEIYNINQSHIKEKKKLKREQNKKVDTKETKRIEEEKSQLVKREVKDKVFIMYLVLFMCILCTYHAI